VPVFSEANGFKQIAQGRASTPARHPSHQVVTHDGTVDATTYGAGERAHRAAHQEPDCSTGNHTTGKAVRSAFTRAIDIGNFGIVEFTHDDSPYLNTIV